MKTRQEMIYDFMVALLANHGVFEEWQAMGEIVGSYSDHVIYLAQEMADKYLSEVV